MNGATGTQGIETDVNLSYNPSTNTLTTGTFSGTLSGNASSANIANHSTYITVNSNNSTDESVYLTFVDTASGTLGIETDTGLTYNPSSNVLSTGTFNGNLSGNVTGNVVGNVTGDLTGTTFSCYKCYSNCQ